MGKKGFNWKARQNHDTKIDDSETQKIHVELPSKEYGAEDASNALVLPSSKRHTKVKKDTSSNVRILSKQQRKKLEKIVEKKKKKENRASLLEALAKVQVNPEELKQMTSISSVQSMGLKKNLRQENIEDMVYIPESKPQTEASQNQKIKTIAGSKKRKFLLSLEGDAKNKKPKRDLNVIGLDQSSSGSSASEESDVEPDSTQKDEPVDMQNGSVDAVQEVIEPQEKLNTEEEKNSTQEIEEISEKQQNKRKRREQQKLLRVQREELKKKEQNTIKLEKRQTVCIHVDRDPKIQAARLKLPILGEEQAVVECINDNAIVLIAGETGSGKTTQVPQFLYEAGYTSNKKMIGITEPRRVAAVAMAERVAKEMGLTSRHVSYLMRFEGTVTEDTQIKFMTDGVLLKEIESDFILSKYSVIIIDEAHERSVFTDILIGLLSRIVPLRCRRGDPLRLVVMSATLKIEDFTDNTRLFKSPPPIVKIETRQFPVTIHFNKRTEEDYMKAAFAKVIKIHTKLPEGGILVFVTGQQEVHLLVKKLRSAFPFNKYKNKFVKKKTNDKNKKESADNAKTDDSESIQIKDDPETTNGVSTEDAIKIEDSSDEHQEDDEFEMMRTLKKAKKVAKEKKNQVAIELPEFDLNDFDAPDDEARDDLLDEPGEDIMEDSDDENEWGALAMAGAATNAGPLWVLPLYSMLPPAEQTRVFQDPPEGTRLCVIATNVAETSLTIPNVKYVVDTGKQKTRIYEKVTGASAMRVVWVSHAAASQRAGRAGRVAPGHCYRLYSSAVFQHDMQADREPEIRARPVDDLLLQMKCMGIDKVVNFPFPSAPDILQLKTAEMRLDILGALEKPANIGQNTNKKNDEPVLKVTPLGKAIAAYPVLPRYGKMLALSHQHNLFEYTVCMVSALSVQEVIVGKRKKSMAFGEELLLGDPGALLNIVGASEHAVLSGQDIEAWCASQGVRARALREARLLRKQLGGAASAPARPPGALARPLRQLLLAGLADCVAKRVPSEDIKQSQDKVKMKYAYHCTDMEDPVFMHSGSVLRGSPPDWVVYQEIYEAGEGDAAKMIMRGVTAIEPEWLPIYSPKLCNIGEPLLDPSPRYDAQRDKILCHVNATFGRSGWQLPTVEVDFPQVPDIYRWFAVFLLNGSVCERLAKYTKSLLSPPLTMVKSWAKLQPRTEAMHRTLILKQVRTKRALQDEWKRNPSFLLEAYQKWLPESAHDEVNMLWPPMSAL